jgi:FAD/FMN-containing dehydrogenase
MGDPSVSTHSRALIHELAAIVKDKTFVVDTSSISDEESRQSVVDGIPPAIMVSPSSNDEVSAILELATKEDLVVVPAGGMTTQEIGNTPARVDILLRTDRFSNISYDAAQQTITAGAGVTLAQLHEELLSTPYFLPLDPMLSTQATIGGVLATDSAGPLRSGFGSPRELCADAEFVTGDGKVIAPATTLHGILGGSFGTLGAITSATFRLHSRPARTQTRSTDFHSIEDAVRFRDEVMASPLAPMCLEVASPRAQEYVRTTKPARDPDVYAPMAPVSAIPWKVFVRLHDADIDSYRTLFARLPQSEISTTEEEIFWRRLSDWESLVAARHRNATIVRVSTAIADVGATLAAGEQTGVEHNLLCASIGRIASGSLLVAFLPMGVDPVSAMQFAIAASAFRGRLQEDASAVVVRCPRESKNYFDVWGSTPTDLQLMRAVRQAFDPKRILNRNRFTV